MCHSARELKVETPFPARGGTAIIGPGHGATSQALYTPEHEELRLGTFVVTREEHQNKDTTLFQLTAVCMSRWTCRHHLTPSVIAPQCLTWPESFRADTAGSICERTENPSCPFPDSRSCPAANPLHLCTAVLGLMGPASISKLDALTRETNCSSSRTTVAFPGHVFCIKPIRGPT